MTLKSFLKILLLGAVALITACGGGGGGGGSGSEVQSDAVITIQPANQSVVVGTAATFSVTATNAIGYQWQISTSFGLIFSNIDGATASSYTTSVTAPGDSGTRYRVIVTGANNSVTSSSVILTVLSIGDVPPDPASVASRIDPASTTDVFAATAFLYSGNSPIQTGVAANTIKAHRVAVLRGQVLNRDNSVLPGVTVSVLGHPELGQTITRGDGMFDLAVNGGGQLTLKYEKNGFLTAQRAIDAPWRDYVWLPDVVMVQLDTAVTSLDLGTNTLQVARGSAVTDTDGTRQATVLVPAGTTASMVLADGATQPLTTINLRATEFTVGANGPQAMPATLPATSGYTYAAEFSIDEAIAAGATEVRFSQALPVYVENFLGFAVGSAVPAGYYDREKGQWIASPNGRVIKVISIANGLANLDTNGDAVADDATTLAALGVTSEERTRLALLYTAGQTLWRVPVTHFTPWDFNWPFGPPPGAIPPPVQKPKKPKLNNQDEQCGSVIGCEDQTLGESVAVSGTPFRLHYQSERTPGRKDELSIPLTDASLPLGLKSIELEVSVAGKRYVQRFMPAPNLNYSIIWDGTDAYGRTLLDTQKASVHIGYTYQGVYMDPVDRAAVEASAALFGHFTYLGTAATGNQQRLEVTLWSEYETPVSRWDNRALGLNGWTLDIQHAYDPTSRTLLLGNGKRRRAEALSSIITTVGGNATGGFGGDGGSATAAQLNAPTDVAVGPDGSVYIADTGNNRIRRIGTDGLITTVAGNGTSDLAQPNGGDGGPAVNAILNYPFKIAIGPDGSLYIADGSSNNIRRVGLDGIISTVLTTPSFPHDIAVGSDGSLYIVYGFAHQIQRVGTDGVVSVVAGIWGSSGYSGDGGLATGAQLWRPTGIEVGADGSLYIADSVNQRVRRVTPDGIITTFAGNGNFGFSGDGGPATSAEIASQVTYTPLAIGIGTDGSLHIAEPENKRIRSVGSDGIITTIAGNGLYGFTGDMGPAKAARLSVVSAVSEGPDGSLYIADRDNNRIRRIAPLYPEFSASELLLASEDGREIYLFNSSNHHTKTLDALTGAVRYEFGYDTDGYLISITDGNGNITGIERVGATAMAIVAPGGQRTSLIADVNGWLASATNPANETHNMSYSSDGLLQTFIDPRGKIHTFTYNSLGLLIKDEDPLYGSTSLARTEQANGYTVTTTSALGRTHSYQVEQLSTGVIRRTITAASGAKTIILANPDGSEQITNSDGSTITVTYGPDPRFGMLAPVASRVVETTPGGRTRTLTRTRTATLADPNNLLSLSYLADTATDNGVVSSRVYNNNGITRTLTYTSAAGRSFSVSLDALGRVTAEQTSGLVPVNFTYNFTGLVSSISEGNRTTDFTYNVLNELTGITDPLNRTSSLVYDNAGRVTSLNLPGARTVALTHDASGNATSITPPGRSAHVFTYTSIDQVASYTAPTVGGSSTTQYNYNVDRVLTQVTRPGAQVVDVTYDIAGRTSTLGIARGSIGYSYNNTTNQLTGVSAPGGLGLSYSYDGNLLTGVAWSGAVSGSTGYTYNNNMRVTAESVNAANSVSFTYDADGLLSAAGSLVMTRDAQNGLLTGSTLSNVVDSLSYSTLGEPDSYSASYNSTGLYSAVYTRDAIGRITQKVETISGTSSTYVYGYDSAGRLNAVSKDGVAVEAYSYDANGNRTASNGVSASYDAQDRLTSFGTTSYSYTANGELLSKTAGVQTTAYQYDELGNLLQVTLPSGDVIDYLIDGENRRIGKRVNGTLMQGFLYQGALRPVAELNSSNTVVSRFVYATRTNVPDYMIKGGVTYRIITDQLGSPRLVVNVSNGTIAQRMDYDAFGQVLSDTNPGFQPFGFAGGLYDSDTKIVRFGARDYDAETGRWTAKDPIMFAGGDTNLFAYVSNDPVNFVDSTGLFSGPVCHFERNKDASSRLSPQEFDARELVLKQRELDSERYRDIVKQRGEESLIDKIQRNLFPTEQQSEDNNFSNWYEQYYHREMITGVKG